jgi:ORF6N domain
MATQFERVSADSIRHAILLIRGQRVMLDTDLAALYRVPTKALVQAVRRNHLRFPRDFMFRLSLGEAAGLRSQIVTSNTARGRGGRRYAPYAFTEQGVAMLSSVLRSPRAIKVNIAIMRAFVTLRQILVTHEDLGPRLDALERKYDVTFKVVFDAIRELMSPSVTRRHAIGFRPRSEAENSERSPRPRRAHGAGRR